MNRPRQRPSRPPLTRAELAALVSSVASPASAQDRDEMAIPSHLHRNPLIRWLMWRRYEVLLELARFRGTETVLEFGCGTGLFLPVLARQVASVHALDLFPEYAMALCQRLAVPVVFADTLDDVPAGSLDAVIAADVLEHVDDVAALLCAFRTRLRPGGVLLASGPTETPVYRLGRWLAGFGGKGHYHHTDVNRLFERIVANGFIAGEMRTLPFRLSPPLFRLARFELARR